jgi:hypothetical protein
MQADVYLPPRLFMILLGCKPPGRFTEQHDIFFGIASSLPELVPAITASWPEAPKIHIDAWREVTETDGYSIEVIAKGADTAAMEKLFFLNLGGYKKDDFEEYHYKMLAVASDKGEAVDRAKQSAFYKHTGFHGATSHIDDKYGVDVDDLYEIADILPAATKEKYALRITRNPDAVKDKWHLGYTKLSSLI